MSNKKLDLFKLLSEFDKNNYSYYESLSVEEKKEISSIVLMRWLSATYSNEYHEYYCLATNKILNMNLFDLYDHPELIFRLAASIGLGKPVKHCWIAMSKKSNNKIKDFIFKKSNFGTRDFELYWESITEEEISEILSDHAMTEKDFK